MKLLTNTIFIFLFFMACQNTKESTPTRISLLSSDIISDSIESMMPGKLLVSEKYVLWTDPFHSDKFIHVLDKNTGKEISTLLQKGEGPTEFLTPEVTLLAGDRLFIFDYNSNKTAILSIDNAVRGEDSSLLLKNQKMKNTTRMINTQKNEYVYFSPSDNRPFLHKKGERENAFGKLPIGTNIVNSYDHFQGEVAYSPSHNKIVYSTYLIPYMAIYEKKGDSFSLYKENMKNNDYQIKDNSFFYNGMDRGALELTLLADYIVTLERDRKIDHTDDRTTGRDFTKLPQTVFLYDYDLNLKKIVNLGMPILRLASDPSSNVLYTIGVNPDFVLMKYEL